jgi:hypothetical protein
MLFVVDTDRGGPSLNTRTAYVGPTRGGEDIRVYCDNKERIVRDPSRDVSHRSAIEPRSQTDTVARRAEQPTPKPQRALVVALS